MPDPFAEAMDLSYHLPGTPVLVSLRIFGLEGFSVKRLLDEAESGPASSVRWGGVSDAGHQVPSGMYIVQV